MFQSDLLAGKRILIHRGHRPQQERGTALPGRGEVLEEAARTRRADLRTRGIGVQRTRRQSPLSGKLRIAAPERLVLTGRRLT